MELSYLLILKRILLSAAAVAAATAAAAAAAAAADNGWFVPRTPHHLLFRDSLSESALCRRRCVPKWRLDPGGVVPLRDSTPAPVPHLDHPTLPYQRRHIPTLRNDVARRPSTGKKLIYRITQNISSSQIILLARPSVRRAVGRG